MTNDSSSRSTVSTNAKVSMRIRPTRLLMLFRVRTEGATLELGLAESKRRCADTAERLKRLGAQRVEAGDPHEDELANPDPMARLETTFRRRRQTTATPFPKRPGVNVSLTALWEVGHLSAEEILVLVDQLRYDAAADVETPKSPAPPTESRGWPSMEDQLQSIVEHAMEAPPEDYSPKFLFIASPGEDELVKATADAYIAARKLAERAARATGRQLGEITGYSSYQIGTDQRADRLMESQRCAALLGASAYQLEENEVVTEDSRAVEVSVSMHTTHELL